MRLIQLLPLLLCGITSCAATSPPPAGRTVVHAWRAAGAALPAGAARTAYLKGADETIAQVDRLREAETGAFRILTTVGERHDAGRDDLYAPFATLAERRTAILLDYARTRVAMRAALSESEWTTVVKAVQ